MHDRRIAGAMMILLAAAAPLGAQHPAMPPGTTHEEHLRQMRDDQALKKRGSEAMGFDQEKTAHHFRLTGDGGVIEVAVRDPADIESLAQMRTHLKQIAGDFGRGVFDKPFATHGEMPPGVVTLQRLKAEITYAFEETRTGALVRVRTSNDEARGAVHEFLRYQIREHATGDPM